MAHNIFGIDVGGNIVGDREDVAPSALFATIDAGTGGGVLNVDGVVPLRNSTANPAVSGADSLLSWLTGCELHRPSISSWGYPGVTQAKVATTSAA